MYPPCDYDSSLIYTDLYPPHETNSNPRVVTVYPAAPPIYFSRQTDSVLPSSLVSSLSIGKKSTAMEGLVMPQPSTNIHDSEFNNRCPAPVIGDSNTTLWQFLLELLRDGGYPHLIQWTNHEGEFKLLNAEGVAQLWGKRKGKEHMNYDKLSRALRYYYDKNIIKKVNGQKFVYRFVDTQGSFPHITPTRADSYSHSQYRPNGMKNLLGQGLSNNLGIDLQSIKKEEPIQFPIPTSSLTPIQQQMNTPDLAALNLSGVSSNSNDTPSPTDSSCSPNSLCSSSGLIIPTGTSPPGPSSRPNSVHNSSETSSTDISHSRKRKASPPPPIKVGRHDSTPQGSRKTRPENLDLAATQYLNPTLPMAVSPMHVMQQMSPFLMTQQMQLYALASASLCGPNSPLFSGLGNTNSPFRSPLSTPKMTQVFQFPPVSSTATAVSSALASCLMNSPAILSAGLGSNTFKFPVNDVLKTPTLPMLSQLTKPVPVNSDS